MSRLWEPGSTIRPAPRTPAAETAAPQNLHDLGLAGWPCQGRKTIWLTAEYLLQFLLLWWLGQAWWGSQGQNQWHPPSPPDLLSFLDRLPILVSDHPSSRQTPTKSSRQVICYRTWCWGIRGFLASNQARLFLHSRLQYQLPPLPLCHSDSSLDKEVQGMWPHWEGRYPLRDPCLWNPNDPPMSTWSPLWGPAEDLPLLLQENQTVSLSGLFTYRFVIL